MPEITYSVTASTLERVPLDTTLTTSGMAADAKAVGDKFDELSTSYVSNESFTTTITGIEGDVDNVDSRVDDVEALDSDTLKSSLLDFIYPVGSVYMTMDDSADPAELFGGTWARIAGKFLRAASDGESAGTTGGADTHTHDVNAHTLTVNEIPSHAHGSVTMKGKIKLSRFLLMHNNSANNKVEASSDNVGSTTTKFITTGKTTDNKTRYYSTTAKATTAMNVAEYINVNGTHSHPSAGGGQGHSHTTAIGSNVPAYIVVNVWKRTA